jgi:hypothetical protein
MGLLEEGATADGGESGWAGAGSVEKRGLLAALRRGEAVVFAGEMRLGLLPQVRRVWGRRGEKLRWGVELRYEWVYLVLGVDAMRGLGEAGTGNGDSSGAQDVVWDHAAFHKAKVVGDLSAALFA